MEPSQLSASFGWVDLKYSHTSLYGLDLPGVEMNLGVVLNDHWLTGLTVHGAGSSRHSFGTPPIDVVNPRLGYFFIGWNNALVIAPYSLINVSFPLRMGVGGVTYSDRFQQGVFNSGLIDQDYFFAIEPGIDLTINVSKHIGLTLGASYRFVEGVNNAGTKADFQQPFYTAGLRFRIF